ncbi:MAG: DUF4838 domain-containing protein [Candidatus Hydrogenedentes bacterium]|nr:DUF4838 domain-containing protein [Candidatus Hydrogenedentota bacterium]
MYLHKRGNELRSVIFGVSVVSAAMALMASGYATAETPVYHNEPSGQYLQQWLLCGPFPFVPAPGVNAAVPRRPGYETDYLQAHGGERAPRVLAGQVETFEGGSTTWTLHHSTTFDVNLDEAVSKRGDVLAYGYCEIQSAAKVACVLAVGSNDGIRVWLNGDEVLDAPTARGLRPDDDLIPVVLDPGRNTLLVKVTEHGNKWGFCCRLLPFSDAALNERLRLFEVVTDEAGVARLRCLGSDDVQRYAIQRTEIEAVALSNPNQVLWKTRWTGKRELPIRVSSAEFDKYLLRLTVDFKGGAKRTMEIPFTAGKRVEHVLFADANTDYCIVVGENASESEQWAAKELQHWLKEASGADFRLCTDVEPACAQEIVVGWNTRAQKLLGKSAKAPKDADESYTYQNVGPHIVIWGGNQRGTMNGVFAFLDRELGCRWYTPRVSVIPKKPQFIFTRLFHHDAPGIRVRNDFYFEAFEPIWAARNHINGAMNHREQPGGLECYWAVHTFFPLMPPAEFFESHPEYYSLIDGKRIAENAQLCVTNPDVVRILTERITKVMREKPEYLIYDVSQNDWANPCQCDKCQAIAQREESESGPVINLVNQIAEAVEKEFPDKFIGTLAYQYTRKPCKTLKPRHNVVVRLCSIECCFSHDFLHCPENESFVRDMEGWAKIAPHLYIWDYVVNFSHYIMPYPNFRVLQPNLQFFRDHNAIGVMEQAAYQSRGGEFAELRMYVISKLLWNPECDVPHVIDDFMYGYYGRSGQYVKKYFDLLHSRITPDTHIHLGLRPDDKLFSDEFVREAEAIFDRAEIVADNDEIRRRVEVARLPIMYLKCKRMPAEAKRDQTYTRFTAITEREDITHYAESGEPHREAFHAEMKAVK